jgi:hypothetical protein
VLDLPPAAPETAPQAHKSTHAHPPARNTHTHGAPGRIKKRIEDLIEREFLARVEGQPSQYAYIA